MERMMSKSQIITEYTLQKIEDDVEIVATYSPIHPGEILASEFMEPLGLSAGQVAKACLVPRTRIERIVRAELGISADTALRLARLFDIAPEFWLNLQKRYEMLVAQATISDALQRISPVNKAA
jgi:antitoxin HigA-1